MSRNFESDLRNYMPAIDYLCKRLVMDMVIAVTNDERKKSQERRCCKHSQRKKRRKT